MKIKKLVIKNYKKYRDISIELNSGVNIFVGDNNSGKSTILEAISMVLTGKINGIPITNKLNLDWFNYEVREEFKSSIINKSYIDPPSILIEAYFETESLSDNDIKLNSYRGSNNSLSEDSVGVKIDIEQTGEVFISSPEIDGINKAIEIIENITREAEVGEVYLAEVKRIEKFGAFVELFPGVDALVHISKLSAERVNKVEDVVKIGDTLKVKVIKIDEKGRVDATAHF